MKRADGSAIGETGDIKGEKATLAGMLGPPPRLPDPDMSWDELVEEAAASEYLAKERQSRGEAANDDD